MRKLRVFESISIDGYFTAPDGDMSFAHAGRGDAEFASWVSDNASSGGALLFGRKTYEMMAAFWPTPMAAEQMPRVAAGMNAAKKYVVSHSLEPKWQRQPQLAHVSRRNSTLQCLARAKRELRQLQPTLEGQITIRHRDEARKKLGEAERLPQFYSRGTQGPRAKGGGEQQQSVVSYAALS